MMPQVDRFSVSLDTELLAAFDRHIADWGYVNRSEAIRDMIRDLLVSNRLQRGDETIAAVLSVVCDHQESETSKRLRSSLVAQRELVAGSLSIPIDQHRDILAIGLTGCAGDVQNLANEIQAMRGVTHGRLSAVPLEDQE
jgi:CopG family nickel-responsive transcriptional regulator